MAKIEIKDLPAEMAISEDELRKVMGGAYGAPTVRYRILSLGRRDDPFGLTAGKRDDPFGLGAVK